MKAGGGWVLGIDPGPTRSGYVIWFPEREVVIAGADQVANKLILTDLIGDHRFASLGIEQVKFYGKKMGDTLLDTAFWTGRFCQEYEVSGAGPERWNRVPRPVHAAYHCGTTQASKADVKRALAKRFPKLNLPANEYHLWDALAVAVYVADNCDSTGCVPTLKDHQMRCLDKPATKP